MSPKAERTTAGLIVIWAAATVCGFALLLQYKNTPTANEGRPPEHWPGESRLEAATDRATLVTFAHPHCACTQATVSELARLMSRVSDQAAVHIVIVKPPGVDESWDDSELGRRAALVQGATVTVDDGADEASLFRAQVSGLTLLYDRGGRLRFAGGLTSARGHEGDSFGLRRVAAVLAGEEPDRADAPVFGCTLGVHGAETHMEEHEHDGNG